jgi:hypothetical protein
MKSKPHLSATILSAICSLFVVGNLLGSGATVTTAINARSYVTGAIRSFFDLSNDASKDVINNAALWNEIERTFHTGEMYEAIFNKLIDHLRTAKVVPTSQITLAKRPSEIQVSFSKMDNSLMEDQGGGEILNIDVVFEFDAHQMLKRVILVDTTYPEKITF